jgi:uncharacterized protein YbjQ (UPF0145 family)
MASTSSKGSKDDAKPSNKPFDEDPPACFTDTHGVITSTMNDLPGYRIVKVLGTVYGLTVRSRNWGVDIGAVLRSVVGGEIGLFTRLMYSSRNEALERLVGEAMGRGGNAVVAVR